MRVAAVFIGLPAARRMSTTSRPVSGPRRHTTAPASRLQRAPLAHDLECRIVIAGADADQSRRGFLWDQHAAGAERYTDLTHGTRAVSSRWPFTVQPMGAPG